MRKTVVRFAGGDLTSELLHAFRVSSSVLCRSVMAPPWGFGVAARDAASFHVLIDGEGWLAVDGIDGPTRLRTGDLVVLPRGNAHWVRDAPASEAPPLTSILAEREVVDGELHFGGDSGPLTEIVCGVFQMSGGPRSVPSDVLPAIIHAPASAGAAWWAPVASAVRDELRAPSAGGSAVVNRLLESLLADAIRTAAPTIGDGEEGSAALADPRMGAVLARMRERPDVGWTVGELARMAAMSRSAFVDRFRALVGTPPMRHLTSIRLAKSLELLRTTDLTVAEIGRRVGYGSEEAFSRAFRARFGDSPTGFRKSQALRGRGAL